jgi:hypothetical protein
VKFQNLFCHPFSPFGCFVVRWLGVACNACGDKSHVSRRRDGWWSSCTARAYLRHVDDFDMLLVMAMENFVVSSSRRALASSCNLSVFPLQLLVRRVLVEGLLHSPVAKMTGRPLYGPKYNFSFLKGCLYKGCNVLPLDRFIRRNEGNCRYQEQWLKVVSRLTRARGENIACYRIGPVPWFI